MKKYFLAGILVWAPLAITIWVITWALGILDSVYGSVMMALITVLPSSSSETLRHFREIPGLGILIVVVSMMLTGPPPPTCSPPRGTNDSRPRPGPAVDRSRYPSPCQSCHQDRLRSRLG